MRSDPPSDRTILANLLAAFRAYEAPTDALLILGDADAAKVLIAWSKTDQEWRPPTKKPPVVMHGQVAKAWTWIVQGWTIDLARVAAIAGVTEAIAAAKIEQLVGARLIYPDGEMSKPASNALAAYAQITIGAKQDRKKQPKKDNTN